MRERSLVEGIKKERERERERCRESEDVRMTVRQTERELTNGREGRDIERGGSERKRVLRQKNILKRKKLEKVTMSHT